MFSKVPPSYTIGSITMLASKGSLYVIYIYPSVQNQLIRTHFELHIVSKVCGLYASYFIH